MNRLLCPNFSGVLHIWTHLSSDYPAWANSVVKKAYRRCWYIEYLFGDSKTRDLNMEDSRLNQPAKFDTLLVVITLAMAWTYASVTTTEGTRAIKICSHGYQYKSWFRLSFDQLRKWILHKPDRAVEIWRRPWLKRNGAF